MRRAGRVAGRGVLSRPRVQRLTRPPRPLAVATSNQLALPDWPVNIWRLTEFVNCLANVPPRRSTQDGASGEESDTTAGESWRQRQSRPGDPRRLTAPNGNAPRARGTTLGDNHAWPGTTSCTGHNAFGTSRPPPALLNRHRPCCQRPRDSQRSRVRPVRSLRVMRRPSSCCASVARGACSNCRRGLRRVSRCRCQRTTARHLCG